MQDIYRKNAKKLTVNPPDMSNSSNLEDFSLILYEAANDECKLWTKLKKNLYFSNFSTHPCIFIS